MKRLSKVTKVKISVAIVFVLALFLTLFFLIYPTLSVGNYNKYLASLEEQKNTQGVQSLKNRNSDFVAWLECEDVGVSVPVVTNSSDFYLSHNFDKQKNSLGTPYCSTTSTLGQSSNTTIVGHSAYVTTGISGDSVFQSIMGNLNSYVDGSSTTNYNNKITIETLTGELNYQIFSAFTFDSSKTTANILTLYNTVNWANEQEFNNYINIATSLSKTNYGQTATINDKFVTLYTCSYSEGYRIMIIAKQIDN